MEQPQTGRWEFVDCWGSGLVLQGTVVFLIQIIDKDVRQDQTWREMQVTALLVESEI